MSFRVGTPMPLNANCCKTRLDSFRPEDTELHDGFLSVLEEDQLDLSLAYRWLTHQALQDSGHTPIETCLSPVTGYSTAYLDATTGEQ